VGKGRRSIRNEAEPCVHRYGRHGAMYAFGAAWAGQIAVVGTGQSTSDASLISAGAHEIAAELKRVGRVGGPQ